MPIYCAERAMPRIVDGHLALARMAATKTPPLFDSPATLRFSYVIFLSEGISDQIRQMFTTGHSSIYRIIAKIRKQTILS